jgi:cytochrome P450
VIKEGLRICPPITGLVLKNVPAGGDTFKGQFIPGGTVIGYSSMSVMMDRKTFGPDVHSFRPERFLEGSEDELKEREAMLENTFGYGRWRCLGRNIALLELNKIVTEVVRNFDFTAVDPTKPFKSIDAGIQVQSGMWMRASRVKSL